jgi:hypothetical protein
MPQRAFWLPGYGNGKMERSTGVGTLSALVRDTVRRTGCQRQDKQRMNTTQRERVQLAGQPWLP